MVNNQILLQGISLEELNETILKGLEKRIQTIIKESEKEPIKYLTRQEVAQKLSISLPTLHDWVKKEMLKAYRIGNRVYFKSNELDENLLPINVRRR